ATTKRALSYLMFIKEHFGIEVGLDENGRMAVLSYDKKLILETIEKIERNERLWVKESDPFWFDTDDPEERFKLILEKSGAPIHEKSLVECVQWLADEHELAEQKEKFIYDYFSITIFTFKKNEAIIDYKEDCLMDALDRIEKGN